MSLMQPEHITITIGNAIATPTAATEFKAQLEAVGTNEIEFSALSKSVDIKSPERTTNEVKLLGATSGIQNQELDPQSPSKAEFSATLLTSPEADTDRDFEQFYLTATASPPSGYTRYNFASAIPAAGVAVVVQFNQGSGNAVINWLMNNATIEMNGGMKIDADGHGEQEVRITCAADDFWKEFDTDGGS